MLELNATSRADLVKHKYNLGVRFAPRKLLTAKSGSILKCRCHLWEQLAGRSYVAALGGEEEEEEEEEDASIDNAHSHSGLHIT